MPIDPVNRRIGRKPLSFTLNNSNTEYIFDTAELVIAFGIPVGMHLVIDLITVAANSADAGNSLSFLFDHERDDTGTPFIPIIQGRLSNTMRGIIQHVINASLTAIAMTPVDVFNTLGIIDSSVSQSILHFFYHFEEGGMDFSQENAEAEVDVRQIEAIQGDPGDQYFQVEEVFRNRQVFPELQ